MPRLLTFCLAFFAASLTFAQSGATLKGKVQEAGGNPVAYANVILHAAADSALAKVEYSGEDGSFTMAGIAAGEYFLEVSFVGMPTFQSEAFTLAAGATKDFGAISLQPATNELEEVTVTARKPIIEVHPDKTVFNVEGTASATGSDALELLRKAPGVIVDNNDNIMLAGKSGVRIFIDGKPSPLTMSDLAAFLRTVQASEIENIEIITNPSARFEAEGNAGIINIRMKKAKGVGTNGTVELGYGIGRFSKYNGSLSLNHRNEKFNLFGKYGLNTGEWFNFQNFYREQSGTSFTQRNDGISDNFGQNFRGGADFFLSKTSTLGILATGNMYDGEWRSASRTEIADIPTKAVQSILAAQSINDSKRDNYTFNVNYRFDNGKGRVLNLDADHARYRFQTNTFQPNRYLSPDEGEVLEERIFGNDAPTDVDLYSFKLDHERGFAGGQLSIGAKTSFVVTDNIFDFYNYIDRDNRVLDPERSNQFEYTENVNAAYVQYQRKLSEKFNFQGGVRMEHTHSLGELTSTQTTGNERVERDYVNLFPSGGLTWLVNEKNSLRLTYSYRIDRPRYQDLNPFEFKLDELTFQRGNPFLQPQYTHSFELGHTLNSRFNTSLKCSLTNDLITQLTDTLSGKRAFISQFNLATQRTVSLNFAAPFSLAKWWNVYANATVYRTSNEGVFEGGKTVDLARTTFNTYMQHTFSLPLGFSFEISGFYNSPSIWGGNFRSASMYAVNTGLSTKILKGKANLKLAVSDIFQTQRWNGINQFGDLYMEARGGFESRRFSANLTYNFGNQEVKSSRRRRTGIEDETNRVGGDGQ